ncbi:DISARM system helicase DrmA [Kitasatospora herbaricolor]|uniref:DISARM system helicase DrmA n=1 Tax=Kitasatospora herbaricolor TaxID=68217 RepID=A0ABZ1WFI8_9ACTN|nr:DISARM system helicase DrmA [Kitasatospora herbaricolor]
MSPQSPAAPDSPPGVPHPVDDVPQTFLAGDSYDVRSRLGTFICRDLLGPWDGETEELPKASAGPRDRYLVGMLGPKPGAGGPQDAVLLAAQTPAPDAESGGDGDGQEAELPELLTPQAAGRIWASSMGFSFVVPASVGMLVVEATWGRYTQSDSLTDASRGARTWNREPVRHTYDVPVTVQGSYREALEGELDGPHIRLNVEVRERPAATGDGEPLRVVEVTLINALEDSRELRDANWLFQTGLAVTAFPDGEAAVFLPTEEPYDHQDAEERRLRLLYRHQLKHAMGRNVAVHPKVRKGESSAHHLATTWLPWYDVPDTTAPSVEDQPLLGGLELSMDTLAAYAVPGRRRELEKALQPLSDGYDTWLAQQDERVRQLPAELRPSAEAAVADARDLCHRIAWGIDALLADDTALEAFRFANQAMALQRRNTAIAAERAGAADTDPLGYPAAKQLVDERGAAAASWRPFQLAFVLLNLASLSDPAHPHRGTGREALVDLLFFPTGGGKTEAYLGLAAFTFALRRLQGTLGTGADARSGEAGVAVLMRYTLRLLTAQQFQRAAALVCAAEVLRRDAYEGERDAAGTGWVREPDTRWGRTPFRIGLWVGLSVSPNWYQEAAEQLATAREAGDSKRATVVQTLSCPWCGEVLRAHRDAKALDGTRRIRLRCARAEGAEPCPFSSRGAHEEEGLPILTVDEEIYRYAPSLLIATVDKLAQLPWRGWAGLLFGRVDQYCPRHGYRHADLDAEIGCGIRHQAKPGLPKVVSQPVTRLRPPDLIIQDELHLISGALGTTVGLFESAVDQLCSWRYTDRAGTVHEAGPKIVASTATTKRAAEQVLGVFGRKVAVFPPQVVDVGDTFFSRQVEVTRDQPGRRYLGICAHGVRLKAAEIRIAEILLLAGQELFDEYGAAADPYMTLVGYFNATRELAGMRRYLDDDITTRVRRNGGRKGISDRIVSRTGMLTIQELTSRISSSDISAALKRLENTFDPERDTSLRRRAINAELRDAYKKRPTRVERSPLHRQAVDVVLATSMLQVGVDVSRFGLMLVVGQPKNTAEYIQASSRVGRDTRRPGLVVTLYNWSRPRDLAHFEDFEHYHATFYRRVEALSVTPYTRRALDRGTAPTYVAALRHAAFEHSHNTDAETLDLDGPLARRVEQRLLDRADAVKGPVAREYLRERIDALKDKWREKRDSSATLGYRGKKLKEQTVVGLLRNADGARWTELTVPQSMRETENEINLLLPGGGELGSSPGRSWSFTPRDTDGEPDVGAAAGDWPVDGDELGTISTPKGAKRPGTNGKAPE